MTPTFDFKYPVTSVDEVVTQIDRIVAQSRAQRSRIGFFAALYHHVAHAFRANVRKGAFKRPDLIDALDIAFVNRYLQALQLLQTGATPTRPWRVTFDAARFVHPLVVQHLTLGMNAHINFDLGVAVAEVCDAQSLPELRDDFITMNDVLTSLLNEITQDLGRVWPLFGLVNRYAWQEEDAMLSLGMRDARALAWEFATQLVNMDADARAKAIAERDAEIAAIGVTLWKPPFPVNVALLFARIGELESTSRTIEILLNRSRKKT
jgi:hypothetical protein